MDSTRTSGRVYVRTAGLPGHLSVVEDFCVCRPASYVDDRQPVPDGNTGCRDSLFQSAQSIQHMVLQPCFDGGVCCLHFPVFSAIHRKEACPNGPGAGTAFHSGAYHEYAVWTADENALYQYACTGKYRAGHIGLPAPERTGTEIDRTSALSIQHLVFHLHFRVFYRHRSDHCRIELLEC